MMDVIKNRGSYIPSELYKYRAIIDDNLENDLHTDALKKEKVYLSNPHKFNDPYDSLFSIDIEKFKENIVYKLKEQIVQKELDKININVNQINNIEIIYDDITIHNQGLIGELIENNPEVFYEEYLKQFEFKVCCFSEIYNSILMWSHYSNNHKGFCIGYETSKIKTITKNSLFPVFYQDILFPLEKTGKLNSLIKFTDWKYEKEWRLIANETFLSMKPSKIYLGVKFDEKHLDYFKSIASEKNCKLYKMYMNYSKYKLEAKKIDL